MRSRRWVRGPLFLPLVLLHGALPERAWHTRLLTPRLATAST